MKETIIHCDVCGQEQRAQPFLELTLGSWLGGETRHACGPKCQAKMMRMLADQVDPQGEVERNVPRPSKVVCYVLKGVDATGKIDSYLWYVSRPAEQSDVTPAFVEGPGSAMRFERLSAHFMARVLNTSGHRVVVVKRVRKHSPESPAA